MSVISGHHQYTSEEGMLIAREFSDEVLAELGRDNIRLIVLKRSFENRFNRSGVY